jgi:hypothetical protein
MLYSVLILEYKYSMNEGRQRPDPRTVFLCEHVSTLSQCISVLQFQSSWRLCLGFKAVPQRMSALGFRDKVKARSHKKTVLGSGLRSVGEVSFRRNEVSADGRLMAGNCSSQCDPTLSLFVRIVVPIG